MNLYKLYRNITGIGLSPGLPFKQKGAIILTNIVAAFALLASSIYVGFFTYVGHWAIVPIPVCGIIAFLSIFLLQQKGLFSIAKFGTILLACVDLYILSSVLGTTGGAQWMLLPIMIANIMIFYSEPQRWKFIVAILTPILIFFLLEFSDYHLLFSALEFSFSPLELRLTYFLNAWMVILSCAGLTVFYYLETERKSKQLNAHEISFQQGSEAAKVGFIELDIRKGKTNWESGIQHIMGTPDDFVFADESFFDHVHPEDRAELFAKTTAAFVHGNEILIEYRFIRPVDGQTIHIKSSGRILKNSAGKPYLLRSMVMDVTAERAKEAKIEEAKLRAEAANQAKSQFLSNMSHEIRTPLNGILGFAQLLEESKLSPTQLNYVYLLTSSGKTLLGLIEELLDVTKIEQGKIEITPSPFKLSQLIDHCLAPYRLQADEKGLQFEHINHVSPQLAIVADELRVKQVLSNLVNNALKYTPAGRVEVEIDCSSNITGSDEMMLRIEVRDTGRGIPEKLKKDIFKPFTQVDRADDVAQKGLGLGLSIVYSLLELMGGKIELVSPWLEDTAYPGSKFIASIPVKKYHQKIQLIESPQSVEQFCRPIRILVAEDNEVNQILIKAILEQAAFHVALVSRGDQAVEYVAEHEVDLVLMDIRMPEMDGYEATRQIRRSHPDLVILALSANAYEEDIQQSLAAGMNGHLSKPIQVDKLLGKITELMPELLVSTL